MMMQNALPPAPQLYGQPANPQGMQQPQPSAGYAGISSSIPSPHHPLTPPPQSSNASYSGSTALPKK